MRRIQSFLHLFLENVTEADLDLFEDMPYKSTSKPKGPVSGLSLILLLPWAANTDTSVLICELMDKEQVLAQASTSSIPQS